MLSLVYFAVRRLVTDADGALGAPAPAPTVCRGHSCGQ
jgi:hypothetical protein